MIGRFFCCLALISVFLSSDNVFSEENPEEDSSEIHFYVGGFTGDSFVFQPPGLITEVKAVFDDDITAGFRYAYYFKPHLAGEFGVGFSPSTIFTSGTVSGGTSVTSAIGVDTYILHANVVVPFSRGKVAPYVTAGVGAVHFRLDTAQFGFLTPSETDFAWNAGGGIKFHAKDEYYLRLDGRIYQMDPEFAENETSTFGEITGGVSILFDF